MIETVTRKRIEILVDRALVPRILRNIDEWLPPKADFGL